MIVPSIYMYLGIIERKTRNISDNESPPLTRLTTMRQVLAKRSRVIVSRVRVDNGHQHSLPPHILTVTWKHNISKAIENKQLIESVQNFLQSSRNEFKQLCFGYF